MNTLETAKRISLLDFTRGVAIFLVLIGHAATDSFIYRPVVYEIFDQAIYTFHMGLFFIISGFLDSIRNDINSKEEYFNYVKLKFMRLMLPFISISILIDILIILKEIVINKDFSSNYICGIIQNNLFYPELAVRGSLWFLYVLFFISILTPLVNKINNKYVILFLIVVSLLNLTSIYLFAINKLCMYLIYYMIGKYVAKNYEKFLYINRITQKYFNWIRIISSFIVIIVYTVILNKGTYINYIIINWFNLLITIIVFLIIQHLYTNTGISKAIKKLFVNLGQCSMDIYIFSWFFQVISMVVLVKIFKVTNYTIFFISNFTIGLLCIPFSKILRKSKIARRFLLGIK